MRTIKFRGKRKFGEGWIYGSLVKETCGDIWIFPEDDTHCNAGGDFYSENYPGIGMVDPSTVGQFTGLHDKDGKEIYEGDILDSLKGRFVIGWGNEHCGFEVLQPYRGKYLYLSDLYEDMTASEDATEYEPDKSEWEWSIIGNIYDNPEFVAEDTNIQMKEE